MIWPVIFDKPSDIVRQIAHTLRPGGVIALFYSNYYRATFLPGHSRLERKLRTASEIRCDMPAEGPQHDERHIVWLTAAGFEDVTLSVFPRLGFPADDDPTVRRFLELTVFPELRKSAASSSTEAGMSADELDEANRLLTPGDPEYVMDEPGYYVLLPAILATGRRPAEAGERTYF